jgi:hypothetical protein
MPSLNEYHAAVIAVLQPMPEPATPEGVQFAEGYRQALEDLRLTWCTNGLWVTDFPHNDFDAHIRRIEDTLAKRLDVVPALAREENAPTELPRAMAAGGSAMGRQEGGL